MEFNKKKLLEQNLAKIAYEGYCESFLAIGNILPKWEKLPEKIQEAWKLSVKRVYQYIKLEKE